MPRFTPDFLDELKTRLRPSDVIGRYVKLKKQGNEWAGLSPFTKEKTPSFFVNDQKGFFHCFSSGKHGDIISFLQETQRMSFSEAVEQLAEEAGLPLPAETPGEAERAVKAKGLAEACAAAAKYFSAMLRRSDGRNALNYLRGREVTDAQIDTFSIGYAPGLRSGLKDALINKGFHEDTLIEAGLIIKPEDGSASYDRFRNRVMFPILGPRDRVIAFGGRALEKEARAKYLNSPETPIFHKGSVLYNLALARGASAEDKSPLIVCEGYMDVIALWGAGVRSAVAPLGTALTEDQLALLWRAADEPVLCFDGDRAGTGAAHRAIDRALPNLKPGKSLSFAFMPQGKDPDDLIRDEGANGFREKLDAARPLVDVLWERELDAQSLDTPERRAALRRHLRELVKGITDPDVRGAYATEIVNRLRDEFSPAYADGKQVARTAAGYKARRYYKLADWQRSRNVLATTEMSPLLKKARPLTPWKRGIIFVGALLNHPNLLERHESECFELDLFEPDLDMLLSEIIGAIIASPTLDSAGLRSHLTETGAAGALERVVTDTELIKNKFLRPDAEIDEVEQGFKSALAHHLFESTLKQEVARSASQIFTDGDEGWKAAQAARQEVIASARAGEKATSDGGEDGKRFEDALERMKQTVDKKYNR